jgi:mono/diheme cytochrome c family protein
MLGLIGCVTITTVAHQEVRTPGTTETSASSLTVDSHGTAAAHDATPSTETREKEKAAAAENDLRTEGEKRFRTNCGRCHIAPHKYPPRVMATAIRHMRVRATLTDKDMQIIRDYLTR